MKPRSLTPLCRIPRSSSRSTAWRNVACESENARWCTQPGSVGVRVGSGVALLVREDRDEPPVARVEVEVALRLVVEVRLLEDERHAEHALPEVDRRLPVGADERDVVDALVWSFRMAPAARRASTCTRCAARLPHGTSSTRVWTTSTLRSLLADRVGERGVGGRAARELDADGQRRLLLHARRLAA